MGIRDLDAAAAVSAPAAVSALNAALVAEVAARTAADSAAATSASATFQPLNQQPVAPSMSIYEHLADTSKRVLYQFGSTFYAADQATTGKVYKSTDNGQTWTQPGATGMLVKAILRVEGTGTLLAVEDTDTTQAGQNPRVMRSTNDGVTWGVATTLNFPVLGSQGITATPSGYIMIGEYGNVANTVYRVMRSTNDGVAWSPVLSSPGTDVASDPGHIHSVVYDKFAAKFIATMDRPNQEHYVSTDEGATWALIGIDTDGTRPNWVAPMFFTDNIAWGTDNTGAIAEGKISRISRSDYYAGTWGNVTVVAQTNHRSFYGTFPIGNDVWIVTGATEHSITDPNPIGNYGLESFLVYNNGTRVAGGLTYAATNVVIGTLKSYKLMFPSYAPAVVDHGSVSWLNLNIAANNAPYSAVPYSAGVSPAMVKADSGVLGPLMLPNNGSIMSKDFASTTQRVILTYTNNNRTVLANPSPTTAPEIRLYETPGGQMGFLLGGTEYLDIQPSRISLVGTPLEMVSSGSRIIAGTGSPEGAVTATPGSLFMRSDGGSAASFYVKQAGSGNTGWMAYAPVNTPSAYALPLIVGMYHSPSLGSSTASMAEGLETALVWTPMRSGTLDRLSVVVVTTAGSAGALIRLGLRAWDTTNARPGALIVDGGTIDATTTGAKEVTISTPVVAGVPYVMTATCQGAAVTRPTIFTATGSIYSAFTNSAQGNPQQWAKASVSGALDDVGSFTAQAALVPRLHVRASS